MPCVVDSFPADVSPYGVRGLAGNTSDWCADAYEDIPPKGPLVQAHHLTSETLQTHRRYKGGNWQFRGNLARSTRRGFHPGTAHLSGLGIRLVRSLDTTK